jgi:dihydrodipicolinate synthase/N-acetylneuraminate lyase
LSTYARDEARAWARENFSGCTGSLMPTFTTDLAAINERAIRHDVRLDKELGISGLLIVSECGTTLEELKQFTDLVVDEVAGELMTVAHAALPTLEQNIELARYSESVGVDALLVSYPLTFYPVSEDGIFEYTKALAESTRLAVILFAMHLWNFRRFHPSHFSPDLIGRLIDEVPNVAAVKTEIGGGIGVSGISQIFERYRDVVVVTDPIEANAPAWAMTYGLQWIGTSNYEAYAGEVPRYFELLRAGRFEEAMDIYWQLHPIREADAEVIGEASRGTHLVHRLCWKYQGWLNGFNGGPIRSPHMRLSDRQMRRMRDGLRASGLPVTDSPDAEFFIGRNPE